MVDVCEPLILDFDYKSEGAKATWGVKCDKTGHFDDQSKSRCSRVEVNKDIWGLRA